MIKFPHNLSVKETAQNLKTSLEQGSTDDEAKKRILEFGRNRIIEKK